MAKDVLTEALGWVTTFASVASKRREKVYLGIDPGSEGAMGFICGSTHTVVDIPTMQVKRASGKKTVFNYQGILELVRCLKPVKDKIVVCLEVPPPSMGPGQGSAYGQFRLGIAYGIWPLFCLSRGFQLEEVSPSVWKKAMGLSPDKETSRHKAMSMFLYANLSRKKDHNRAEALMLAEYMRRKESGG